MFQKINISKELYNKIGLNIEEPKYYIAIKLSGRIRELYVRTNCIEITVDELNISDRSSLELSVDKTDVLLFEGDNVEIIAIATKDWYSPKIVKIIADNREFILDSAIGVIEELKELFS